VETKTQYRYRTKTTVQEYSDWGAWSDWTTATITADDLTEVETATVWRYHYYICPHCNAHICSDDICSSAESSCGAILLMTTNLTKYTLLYPSSPQKNNMGTVRGLAGGTTYYYTYINGTLAYANAHRADPSSTGYRSRTRTLEDVAKYSEWSDWSDTKPSGSDIETETRTVYRYRDGSQTPTYHFERWGEWFDWSAEAVSATDTRQVEDMLCYRYRDLTTETTYWFRRWTDWSEYVPDVLTPSETTEVETKTQYRYRVKQ